MNDGTDSLWESIEGIHPHNARVMGERKRMRKRHNKPLVLIIVEGNGSKFGQRWRQHTYHHLYNHNCYSVTSIACSSTFLVSSVVAVAGAVTAVPSAAPQVYSNPPPKPPWNRPEGGKTNPSGKTSPSASPSCLRISLPPENSRPPPPVLRRDRVSSYCARCSTDQSITHHG